MATHRAHAMTPFRPLYAPGPVFSSPEQACWQVRNYQDAVEALRLQAAVPALAGREGTYQSELSAGPMGRAMWVRDDPAHSALRKMTEANFRSEAIAPIIASTRLLAGALLSRRTQQEPAGQIELVEEYTSPLAREAVCKGLVGIDPAQEDWLRAWQDTHPSALLLDEPGFVPT